MNEVVKAIKKLKPGSKFSFGKNAQEHQILEYEYLIWIDQNTEPPSKDKVDQEIIRQQSLEYQELRAPEYPSVTELADAIYWQSQGDNSKMTAYLASVQAVKEKYPKGQ